MWSSAIRRMCESRHYPEVTLGRSNGSSSTTSQLRRVTSISTLSSLSGLCHFSAQGAGRLQCSAQVLQRPIRGTAARTAREREPPPAHRPFWRPADFPRRDELRLPALSLSRWRAYLPLGARRRPASVARKSARTGNCGAPSGNSNVQRSASLLKRWLLGIHQGAVRPAHLDYYLDEFTFRFNRRTSASRGKLFYRLVQQAVEIAPAPLQATPRRQPQALGVGWVN